MKVLLIGNTGFKGTWMTFFLSELGHNVSGISLSNSANSQLFQSANALGRLSSQFYFDIRDSNELKKAITKISPERVIHFASQAYVTRGYQEPKETFEVNVAGTLNVLNVVADSDIEHLLVSTSDKVYQNIKQSMVFLENDELGGSDPYSGSKAVQDFLISQRVKSDPQWKTKTTIVRAGNVIGYGDNGPDRLLSDIVNASKQKTALRIRRPDATRPWQHVLDCLNGYHMATEYSIQNSALIHSWNFGPDDKGHSVRDVLRISKKYLDFEFVIDESQRYPEKEYLRISAERAKEAFGWIPKFSIDKSIELTLSPLNQNLEPSAILQTQIRDFLLGR
jgi:CDP-glucose 4,6-dehydratase